MKRITWIERRYDPSGIGSFSRFLHPGVSPAFGVINPALRDVIPAGILRPSACHGVAERRREAAVSFIEPMARHNIRLPPR